MPTAPSAGWVVVAMFAMIAIAHVSPRWFVRRQAAAAPAHEVFT